MILNSIFCSILRSITLPRHLSYEGGIHISNYRLTYQPYGMISGYIPIYAMCIHGHLRTSMFQFIVRIVLMRQNTTLIFNLQ